MGYATVYLVHFLIFAPLTIVTFVINVETPALDCAEEPGTLPQML